VTEKTNYQDRTTTEKRRDDLWLLAMTTGLRRGELAGLRWPEVDLGAGKLTVAGARVSVRYQVVASAPKTTKSRRTIALAPVAVEALRAHRRVQLEERMAWGPAWIDTGLVFTREDGTGYHPEYFTWAFQRAAKRAGLPVIAFHAVRHLHATAGLRAGADLLTMSRRLGHSSIQVTGDIYSHVVEESTGRRPSLPPPW
jgi:integrase